VDITSRSTSPRVALTHDWLTGFGGAERVIEIFARHFPEAPIFTSIYDAARFGATFPPARVRTSYLQNYPGAVARYRDYLPLMPDAFRKHDLSGFDLVLSSCHAFSKALTLTAKQVHVCYCYTPVRYLWGELQEEYLSSLPPHKALALRVVAPGLRRADRAAADRVDLFLAISEEVRGRIRRFYDRDSEVLYPPVFTEQWTPVDDPTRDYWLIVSRFVPYKKVELAVAACARLGKRLKVVGEGPEEEVVRAAAQGSDSIEFLGFVGESELQALYANASALIFTAHEDFGLAPLEANSCGTPVLAFAGGGALETVVEGISGEFFAEQTVDSLAEAIDAFDPARYDPARLRRHAESFGVDVFLAQLDAYLDRAMSLRSA